MAQPQFLMKNAVLLIISHTGHYLNAEGKPSGWIPTVREIDFMAGHFKEVIHLAVLHQGHAPASTTGYVAKNVRFVGFPPFGGGGLLNKLSILWVMPLVIWKIAKLLPSVDVFQFRAPTSIGLAVIPFLTLFSRKKGWYKYAGNWMQPDMPLSYKAQKWMLEKWQKRPVTINGSWAGQPKHVHTFENPCLSAEELPGFRQRGQQKIWKKPYTACFVGRMEDAKGVHRIIDLLKQPGIAQTIGTFHFVGDGPKMEMYKEEMQNEGVNAVFHGFSSRAETFAIYAQSHLFLLPSDSEGFPKVVAEAAAFGCVPIVSDVSSIGQYITVREGYLWKLKKNSFSEFVLGLHLLPEVVAKQAVQCYALAQKFTFETYLSKLRLFVFSKGTN
jgi:glycosyltransferase involved in cell wall biosynthesis